MLAVALSVLLLLKLRVSASSSVAAYRLLDHDISDAYMAVP
jgi:hypothetical protein